MSGGSSLAHGLAALKEFLEEIQKGTQDLTDNHQSLVL
jgi:hypothetical protein